MRADYWIYQPRPSPNDSWAIHAIVDDSPGDTVAYLFVYSERITNKRNCYDYSLIITYDRLFEVVSDCLDYLGYEFGKPEQREVSKFWAKIARDFRLEK